jgi:phytoene synthase
VNPEVHKAFIYCREVTQQQAKNFYYAFLFLPKAKREAIYVLYAFCRHCDDIVDEGDDIPAQRALLQGWEDELARCYAGRPTHIITQALHQVVEHYSIPREYLVELLRGVEMDLAIQRYATFADLKQYCYRVASVIGLACLRIFGYTHPQVQDYAYNIGIALQLTNIMRDVREDAERGRIYLPLEDLAAFGYPEAHMLEQRYSAAFVALMAFQHRRVLDYYRHAEACLLPGDRAGLIAPEIMAGIYRATLRKIVRHRYNVFHQRMRVATPLKVCIALRIFTRIWIEHALVSHRLSLSQSKE